jgi:hypothetical protein
VLRTNIGNVATLEDAAAALNPTERRKGKTIISVRASGLVSQRPILLATTPTWSMR